MFDSSKESVELYCVHSREKLTNRIRLQWRRIKSHVERLDSQGSPDAANCPCPWNITLCHGRIPDSLDSSQTSLMCFGTIDAATSSKDMQRALLNQRETGNALEVHIKF